MSSTSSACCCCCGPEERTRAASAGRGVTDCPYLCAFVLCLGAQGALLSYAFQNGDLSRFRGLPSSSGEFCGQGAAADKPFLYFCKAVNGRFDATSSHCVASCGQGLAACADTGQQYDTETFAGQLCLPRDKQHLRDMGMLLWEQPAVDALIEAGELRRAWQPVVISGVASIVIAFSYLFFLEWATSCVLWTSIICSVLTPAALGSYMLLVSQVNGADGLAGTGDSMLDLGLGAALCAVALGFACMGCWKVNAASEAVECIKATCECLRDMPTLLFEPVVALMIKVPLLAVLVYGGLHLVTCVAEVHHPVRWGTDHPFVTVEFSPDVCVYLVAYIGFSLWIMEFLTALSQFAVSHAVQLWWSSHHHSGEPEHSPSFAALRGLRVGLCYHMGTLAYGAFVIPFARLPRMLLRGIAAGSHNPVTSPCVACCRCCTMSYDHLLRFLSKSAYMDVAVNGSDFCQAAQRAQMLLRGEATAVARLSGATWLFQVTGLAATSFIGAFLTYLQITGLPAFADETSRTYVEEPIFLVCFSGVVCFLVTLPFMLVLDHVSDSILYCFAVESERGNVDTLPKMHAVNGFTPMPPLGRGGKADCHGPETQALLQRATLSRSR